MRCWSKVYPELPNCLRVDQGTSFISNQFESLVFTSAITVLPLPVECPNSLSRVENYHGTTCTAYHKSSTDLVGETLRDLLQMAVNAVNNTMGSEVVCPTVCLFGEIQRPARNPFPVPQAEKAKAINQSINDVQKNHDRPKVISGLRYKGPIGKKQNELDKL